ncbi:MAG: rhodanese-like domain-containing protein [Candidatus Delongbacteria bacterium]|nr:rhodanese-like domain-containing protein [Candidatus Delongbacteria bacterium]
MKKKWTMLLVVMLALTSIFLTSCKDDSDDPVTPSLTTFEILKDYMDDNGMTFDELMNIDQAISVPWVKTPTDVYDIQTDADADNDYYIMDIRDLVDYDLGHIEGAVNVDWDGDGVLLTAAAIVPDGQTIAVVCYSGQNALHAVMGLRLSGYSDAFSIKWGMSGWSPTLDKWTSHVAQLDDPNWIDGANANIASPIVFDDPVIDLAVASTDGATILAERVDAMLIGGLNGALVSNVLADPASYFLNIYWDEANVTQYGHIDGSYRIKPMNLNNLDPDSPVVTYCWTSQTSSMIAAYLDVLGYDAYTLKFGANAMIYDDLVAGGGSAWDQSEDYPLVPTAK